MERILPAARSTMQHHLAFFMPQLDEAALMLRRQANDLVQLRELAVQQRNDVQELRRMLAGRIAPPTLEDVAAGVATGLAVAGAGRTAPSKVGMRRKRMRAVAPEEEEEEEPLRKMTGGTRMMKVERTGEARPEGGNALVRPLKDREEADAFCTAVRVFVSSCLAYASLTCDGNAVLRLGPEPEGAVALLVAFDGQSGSEELRLVMSAEERAFCHRVVEALGPPPCSLVSIMPCEGGAFMGLLKEKRSPYNGALGGSVSGRIAGVVKPSGTSAGRDAVTGMLFSGGKHGSRHVVMCCCSDCIRQSDAQKTFVGIGGVAARFQGPAGHPVLNTGKKASGHEAWVVPLVPTGPFVMALVNRPGAPWEFEALRPDEQPPKDAVDAVDLAKRAWADTSVSPETRLMGRVPAVAHGPGRWESPDVWWEGDVRVAPDARRSSIGAAPAERTTEVAGGSDAGAAAAVASGSGDGGGTRGRAAAAKGPKRKSGSKPKSKGKGGATAAAAAEAAEPGGGAAAEGAEGGDAHDAEEETPGSATAGSSPTRAKLRGLMLVLVQPPGPEADPLPSDLAGPSGSAGTGGAPQTRAEVMEVAATETRHWWAAAEEIKKLAAGDSVQKWLLEETFATAQARRAAARGSASAGAHTPAASSATTVVGSQSASGKGDLPTAVHGAATHVNTYAQHAIAIVSDAVGAPAKLATLAGQVGADVTRLSPGVLQAVRLADMPSRDVVEQKVAELQAEAAQALAVMDRERIE